MKRQLRTVRPRPNTTGCSGRRLKSCRLRRQGVLLLSVIYLGMMTACWNGSSDEATNNEQSSLEGVVVPLLVPRELKLAEHWRIPVSEWEADTGAACDIREYDGNAVSGDVAELISEPALIVCPLSLVPELHRNSVLNPIPEDLVGGWQEVFNGLRKTIGSPGGEPVVFPLSAPPLVCFYRSDLLSQAGLSPPATWAEYRQLVATVEEWAPGQTVVEPWGEESRATMFLQRSAGYALHPDNFSFVLNVSTGDPLIDQPPFVRALDEVRADFAHLDPASLSMGPADCCLQVLEGHAALAIGMLPEPDAAPANGTALEVGISRLPGAEEVFHSQEEAWSDVGARGGNSVTVVGPGAWVVCAVGFQDTESAGHAWQLWNAIDTLQGQGSGSSTPLRRDSRPTDLAGARTLRVPGLDSKGQEQYFAAVTSSLRSSRIVAELPLPEHARFRELLTQRLTEVLEQDRAPQEALQDLAGDWRQLISQADGSSVLNTYRWCLGLSPLPGN